MVLLFVMYAIGKLFPSRNADIQIIQFSEFVVKKRTVRTGNKYQGFVFVLVIKILDYFQILLLIWLSY